MKRLNLLVLFVLVMSLIITACGNASTPTLQPTATPIPATPTATEIPFGCNGEEYIWSDQVVNVPYGQEIVHTYEWSGLVWNATLSCNDAWRYHIVSDLPVIPDGPSTTMTCDGTTYTVTGLEVTEYVCNQSLIFGAEDTTPPQISVRIQKDDRELVFDLEFQLKDVDTVNGPATYLDYLVWGGYPDTGDWADHRCEMVNPDHGLMGFGGGVTIEEPMDHYDAICGSEGFTIEMTTTNGQ